MSAPFIAYFNLPAPRLLRLVHASAQPEELFASSFTSLRVLDMVVEEHFPWPTATLSNLVVLRLKNSQDTRRFCATSLFDLIKLARQLEELQLTEFLLLSGDSNGRPILHANLKSIQFIDCDLKFILQHLRFPNTTRLCVEGIGSGLDGKPFPLPSEGIDYFTPLEALPIPVLDQYIVTEVMVHMQAYLTDNIYLRLSFECGMGRSADFMIVF